MLFLVLQDNYFEKSAGSGFFP